MGELEPVPNPYVSVIIVCFNYGRYVSEAVDSVFAQTFQNFEIILVEGGSTDGATNRFVRALCATRQLRPIFQRKRCTVGRNRLDGLLAARGKYVAFLDADDLFAEEYLAKGVSLLDASAADLLTPDVKFFGDPAIIRTVKGLSNCNIWRTRGITPDIFLVNSCSVSSLFRYSFWKDHPIGYCVRDRPFEDWDFWCRLASHGARSVHLAEPMHLYRVHAKSMTRRRLGRVDRDKVLFRGRWRQLARAVDA